MLDELQLQLFFSTSRTIIAAVEDRLGENSTLAVDLLAWMETFNSELPVMHEALNLLEPENLALLVAVDYAELGKATDEAPLPNEVAA